MGERLPGSRTAKRSVADDEVSTSSRDEEVSVGLSHTSGNRIE